MKRILLLFLLFWTASQLAAREVYPLNADWRFHFAHEESADKARNISLPHTWNFDALAGVYPYFRTQALYSRDLFLPAEWATKRIFLRFGGAESVADLFVNGSYVDSHAGGGVAFAFEITDYLLCGSMNQLVVGVSNAPRNDLMPAASERNSYGGLTRGVELIVTDQAAISPLYFGSEGLLIHPAELSAERAEGEAELHLSIPVKGESVELTLEAFDPEGNRCFSMHRVLKSSYDFQKPVRIPFAIENPRLWSPSSPALYRFRAEIACGKSRDTVSVATGLRTISLSADKGLEINGETIAVRGVSIAYDHPRTGPLMGEREYTEELALAREMGANTLLSAAAPHAPVLYERCDQEGMLARIDLPFARTNFLSDICYYASLRFEQQGEQLLREIIVQHMNHPSVVLWGLFCDLRIVDKRLSGYVERLNSVAQTLDESRPTVATSNQDGVLNFIPDGIVWHQQVGWERGMVEDLAIWLEQMECRWSYLKSAIHYGVEGAIDQQPDSYAKPTPYTLDLPERRQTRFHEEYVRQLAADSLLWGVWIDGLSDYGSARRPGGVNASGLVSFDRTQRKDAFWLYRAWWNRSEKTLHLADKRWAERPDEPQQLRVYASPGLVPTLLINSDTVALEASGPCIYQSAELVLGKRNWITVTAGDLRDEAEIRCGCALKRPQPTAPLQTINLPLTN